MQRPVAHEPISPFRDPGRGAVRSMSADKVGAALVGGERTSL
jgi:hypothetical protein